MPEQPLQLRGAVDHQPARGLILAGTGHRPGRLGGYDRKTHDKLRDFLRRWLNQQQPARVISGMAIGFDLAWAAAALWEGIPLSAYVPFKGQESLWSFECRQMYGKVLEKADKVKVVCEGGYAAWKMYRRNEAMVEACDQVVALWNRCLSGGTYQCVKYAAGKGKEVINLWDLWIGKGDTP